MAEPRLPWQQDGDDWIARAGVFVLRTQNCGWRLSTGSDLHRVLRLGLADTADVAKLCAEAALLKVLDEARKAMGGA